MRQQEAVAARLSCHPRGNARGCGSVLRERVGVLGPRPSRPSRPCGARPRKGACGARGKTAEGARATAADLERCGGRPARGAAGAWSKTDRAPPCGSMWAGPCAAAGPACGTGAPTLAARCEAQTFGLRGGASDLGASRLLMQDALAGARTPEVAIAGVAAFPCIYARAWMPVTRIAAWAVGVWDGRLT